MRCFVPNCENTVGVPFPEDEELKNIWLKSLNILDTIPDEGHFVCLDHFEKDEIHVSENLDRSVLSTAVPKLFPTQNVGDIPFQLGSEQAPQELDSPQNEPESSNFYLPINEECLTQAEEVGDSSSSVVQNQDFPIDEEGLEISNENSNLNSEHEGLLNLEAETEQDEIDNSVQEDGNDLVQEAEMSPDQVLPEESQSLHTDTDDVEQTRLEVFQNYQEGILEANYLEPTTPAQTYPKLVKNKGIENKNQEFQETDSITENDEFLEVQNEFQAQDVPTKEAEFTTESQIFASEGQPIFTSGNEQMFVSEGQNIFTNAGGQHVYVAEGQTILTSEGQQVYMTEGQTVFTTNGQQVFVSEGQTLITQEGQNLMTDDGQVFLQEGEQSFDEQENFVTPSDNFQNVNTEIKETSEVNALEGQMSDGQLQVVENDVSNENMDVLNQHSMKPDQDESESDENLLNVRQLIINEQFSSEIYEPNMEQESLENENNPESQEVVPAAKLVIKKEVDNESPRNIVMEWFVPEAGASTSEPDTHFSGVESDTGKITISYPSQVVSQQHAQPGVQQKKPISVQQHRQVQRTQAGAQQRSQVVSYQRSAMKGSPERHGAIPGKKRIDFENSPEDHCRLCGVVEPNGINILDNIKSNIMILEAIQLCIHPLEVSLEDPFSKKICIRCFDNLQKYFEFRQKCLEMNLIQKRQYEKAHPQHKLVEKPKSINPFVTDSGLPKRTHMKTIISPMKTGYKQTEVVTYSKSPKGSGAKNVTRKIILTPASMKRVEGKHSQEGIQNLRKVITRTSKFDNIQVFKTANSSLEHNGSKYTTRTTSTVSPVIPIVSPKKFSVSQIEALARKPPLSPEKQLKIQEELRKVIEGKMSKDELSVDHVIVRVVSDDESDDPTPTKRRRVSLVNTSVTKTGHSKMRIGKSEVVIPKGIRVTIPDRFESSKGLFACFKKFGAFDTEFSLIDGYLFEHRLRKGRERYLKCLAPNCPARASQRLLTNETFEGRAFVSIPHNHHPLTSTEIKKQMFYYIMRKKMQADRGMNFRNIYDQICKKDPEISVLVPLRSLINEICKHQITQKIPPVNSFEDFYNVIEDDALLKFQFTCSGKQFYQERFLVEEEGTMAVVFANIDTIKKVSNSKLMYVDASFRIEPGENFSYQLVTVLVWIDDSYYPIMFALVSNRTMEIFKKVFGYLHDTLAPDLCPDEIVTDYEANIYYALGETYLDSHIGGSVFYYTQNLYKKICELGLSKELETTSYFRNVYHMLLMLPLLPVNTISDGLENIEIQANDLGITRTTAGLFDHIREQWMDKVTPDLFCVHRLENRINENVIAPFKKLRDFLMLNKGKMQQQNLTLINVVEKLIELENFLQTTYSSDNKKSFGRDLSSSQKKNVLKAWHFIESHPKININNFFAKVIGYIKCMENQLWIWGYYKFSGKVTDDLINAANFSIVNTNEQEANKESQDSVLAEESNVTLNEESDNTLVMEAVVGPSGEFVLSHTDTSPKMENAFLNYVYERESE